MLHDLELAEHYQKYFYTVSANTPELRKIAYQLRYKVYIEDCHFNIDSYDASEKPSGTNSMIMHCMPCCSTSRRIRRLAISA